MPKLLKSKNETECENEQFCVFNKKKKKRFLDVLYNEQKKN